MSDRHLQLLMAKAGRCLRACDDAAARWFGSRSPLDWLLYLSASDQAHAAVEELNAAGYDLQAHGSVI